MRSIALGFLFLYVAVPGVFGAAMSRPNAHEIAARKAGLDFMYLGIPIRPSVVGDNPVPAIGEGDDNDGAGEPKKTDVPDVPDVPDEEDHHGHEGPDEPKETTAPEVPDTGDDEQGDPEDGQDECEGMDETDEPPPQASPVPEVPEDESPAPPAAPVAPASNPLIESISWDGTGCPPRNSEADDANATPSVQVNLEPDGSFGAFFFAGFDAYIGWGSEDDSQIEKECMISMEIVEIPEGWTFQVADLRAEGSIHLALGAVAVFNGTIFWSGDEDHVLSRGKYWPNLEREDPISQQYITDPVVLTAAEQVEFGSACTERGDGPSSGTLNIGFRIAMQSDAEEPPDGLVTVGAIGITSRLAECE